MEKVIGCSIHAYSEHNGTTASTEFFLEPGANANGEVVPHLEMVDGTAKNVKAWCSAAYAKSDAEKIDQKCLNLMASTLFSGFAMTKTNGSVTNVFSFYIKIETNLGTYYLFPNSDGIVGSQWTKIGTAPHDYEELQKRLATELEGGSGTPISTTGLTDATKGHTSSFDVDLLVLGAVLLVGTTATFATEETWGEKRPVVAAFTAEKSGILERIGLRSGTTACTCTSVVLGIFADNAGVPGAILGQGTFPSKPGKNTVISAGIPALAIVAGVKYWLAFLPLGGKMFTPLGAGTTVLQVEVTAAYTKLESNPAPLESYGATAISLQGEGVEAEAPAGATNEAVML